VNPISAQNPLQFAATITAQFVREAAVKLGHYDLSQITALDVGCGEGQIACELGKLGLKTIAIDGNGESIDKARALGVDARETLLANFEHEPFELIYVSRALHHMPPLAETLAKLNAMLSEDGILVIDDFCRELFQLPESAWLLDCLQRIRAKSSASDPINVAEKLDHPRHKWLISSQKAEEILHNWHHHHDDKHKLLTGKEMQEGLEQQFSIARIEAVPCLFRFLCDFLPATTSGTIDAAAFHQEEIEKIKTEQVTAIGLRMVLQKRTKK